jgi:hypothetical protein
MRRNKVYFKKSFLIREQKLENILKNIGTNFENMRKKT